MEKVVFPGLGVLSVEQTSARSNPAKNKLLAPRYLLTFDSDGYDEKSYKLFIEYLATKYKTGKKKAAEQFEKYSLRLVNSIANFGKAEIENLGTFKRDNGKVVFEVSPLFKEILREGYFDIPLVYIDRNDEKAANTFAGAKVSASRTVASKRSGGKRRDWIFPLFILVAISLVFICLVNCLSAALPDADGDAAAGSRVETQVAGMTSGGKTQDASQNAMDEDSIFLPANSGDTAIGSGPDGEDIDDGSKSQPSGLQADTSAPHDNLPLKKDELEKISLDELINLAPELQKAFNKSCIIITGSFVRKSNATRMIKLLIKKGYTPYSEKYGRFHRTGVVFDCEKNSLYDFLNTLRKDIDKQSWVLKWK